ncbi:MAG TPA: hypothetical protein HPP94_07480 [Desulfuromonadales bacterium]|nr:hypothetical protein [Desulfuromonadales bacterium]
MAIAVNINFQVSILLDVVGDFLVRLRGHICDARFATFADIRNLADGFAGVYIL